MTLLGTSSDCIGSATDRSLKISANCAGIRMIFSVSIIIISRCCVTVVTKLNSVCFYCTVSAVLRNTCQDYVSDTVMSQQRTKQRENSNGCYFSHNYNSIPLNNMVSK